MIHIEQDSVWNLCNFQTTPFFYFWLVKMMFSVVQPITAIKAVVGRKATPASTLRSFTAVALHAFLRYKAFHLKGGLY